MPKTEIDYSNTVIYKITCKDPLVTDLYVGHTTNFVQRKHGHKQSCINEKSSNYNCKLYKTIRANGGWDNWVMEIVAFFKCNDHYEARIKEQEYFTSLNATLNSLEPLPKPKPKPIETPQLNKEIKKIYFCETCKITLQNQHLLEVHNQTKKHCKKVMGIETKNVATKFCCENCDFKCCKKSNWNIHINTTKHKYRVNGNNIGNAEINKNAENMCDCGKKYATKSGLWKHKPKCTVNDTTNGVVVKEDNIDKDQLILMLVKQNAELMKEQCSIKYLMMEQQNIVLEIAKNGADNMSHTNSHNKLIIESMCGSGDNDLEKENKIIRNIAKNIVVDKSV